MGGHPPLPDRHHRAAVAALRQDVERRSATAARSPRQASGPAHAGEPHGTAPAARALALAPRRRDRRTKGGACRRIRAHRRAHLRGEAECAAPAARHHVDGRALERDPEKACPGLDPGWVPLFGKDHAPAKNRSSLSDRVEQASDEFALPRKDLAPSIGGRKPCGAINFGKRCLASALGRPFQLEAVRCQRRGIELSFEAPGGDDLPARLNEIAQRKKIALRASTGLLRELALGRLERILPFGIFALRDGPRAPIFLGPERAAGMHEQQFDVPARSSIHENAGPALWHRPPPPGRSACYSRLWRAIVRVTSTGTAASAVARNVRALIAAGRSRQRLSHRSRCGVADSSMSIARLITAATLRSATVKSSPRR